ncbi:aryl-sulfate sulfotransferase [Bacteroidota bacterium]
MIVEVLDNPAPGYYKFDYGGKYNYFLLDNYGNYQYADSSIQKINFYNYKLMSDGNWICFGVNKFYILNQNLDILDSIVLLPGKLGFDPHDIELLPNGHYLVILSDNHVIDMSELIDGGKEDAIVITSDLYEVDKIGNIYWSWEALDHFNVLDVTDDIDLTQQSFDFNHMNSITLDLDGNILISSRHLDEVTKIDKTTGDIIWRMGGSTCRNNEFLFYNDDNNGFNGFSHQHNLTILPNGNLLLFDNGNMREPQFSRAVEYQLNQDAKTATKIWEYRHDPDIYVGAMGSAQRLSNGNTLVNWVEEGLTEVRSDNSITFRLKFPGNPTFHIYRAFKHITKMNAVIKSISGNGTYNFNETNNNTNVSISVSNFDGSGTATIEKHYYRPPAYSINDETFPDILPYRWVFSYQGLYNLSGTMKINISDLQEADNPQKLTIYKRDRESFGIFTRLNTSYNENTNELSADFTNFGEFIICSEGLSKPILSYPENDAFGVSVNGNLKWRALVAADSYKLQVSKSEDFQQTDIDQIINHDTLFAYSALENSTNYFWRIIGMNDKDTSDWSDVSSFSTELSAPILNVPTDGFVGFKMNDSLLWESVPDAQFYMMQLSKTYDFSDSIYQFELSQTAIKLENILEYYNTYYWKVCAYRTTDTSKWSAVWNFTTEMDVPEPIQPINDAINITTEGMLMWNTVKGAQSFSIQISEDMDFKDVQFEVFNISTKSYSYDDLKNNQKYYWRVRAVRTTDSSSWSFSRCFTTLLTKPKLEFPENDASGIQVGVNLLWYPVESADSYRLQLSYDWDCKDLIFDIKDIKSSSHKIKDMPSQKKLFWRVQAVSGMQISDWCEPRLFTTAYIEPPAKPVLLSPGNNSLNNKLEGEFYWSEVPNAINYTLEVSSDKNFNNNIIAQIGITETSQNYFDLSKEIFYYWRVKAYTMFDSSEWSDTWSMRTIDKDYLPPVQLVYPEFEALLIPLNGKLEWEDMPNALAYSVQCSENEDFSNLIINENDLTETFYEYKDLKSFRLYFWRVKYITIEDTSDWSETWEFLTIGIEYLESPTLISPDNNKSSIPLSGELLWDEVPGASKYILCLSLSENFSKSKLHKSLIESHWIDYNELNYNTSYFWRVAAQNDSSSSDWSTTFRFLTELEAPGIISPVNNSNEITESGIIQWTSISAATMYYIQLATDASFNNLIIDEESLPENNYLYELSANTTYYCRVKAFNDNNSSRWSEKCVFTTNNNTGVKENDQFLMVSIFPNPSSGLTTFKFNLSEPSIVNITIINLLGNEVVRILNTYNISGIQTYIFDAADLPSGMYYYTIKIGKRVERGKLLLVR